MARIYYAFANPVRSGGDHVNLEHVEGLLGLGLDAAILLCAEIDLGPRAAGVPVHRLDQVRFAVDDVVVIPEPAGAIFQALRDAPPRKLMHNQNAFMSFFGFPSAQALNQYPLDAVIVPGNFTANRLREFGVRQPMIAITYAVDELFVPAPAKRLQIAFNPNKRPVESSLVLGLFRSRHPDLADTPCIPLVNMDRRECARILGESAVYAAFPHLEALPLMALEAMRAEAVVVGFSGYGGSEYAIDANGYWIDERRYVEFADTLAMALREVATGERHRLVEGGLATVARYTREIFLRDLDAGWRTLLGDRIATYRLP